MVLTRSGPTTWLGLLAGHVLVVTAAAAMVVLRGDVSRVVPAMVLVVPVVLAGLLGGRPAALLTAVTAAIAFNLVFIPPYWTLQIGVVEDGVALGVFALVGTTVGMLVAREAEGRRAAQQRARQLQDMNERYEALADERERLAEEANRVAVLQQVDQQRAALLRSVSHDLRTPLATIRAVTSDLRAGTEYDEHTRDELLDLVGDEAERLDRIVANLLSLSRIEAGDLKPDRQAVALDEVVGDCVRRLERPLGKVSVRLDVPSGLPLADADYSQLDQVFTNLLENAVRHSPERSTVRVGARNRDGYVEVWVDDEGRGILPFERTQIFEPFRRGEGSASSGVGLAICKAVVEAHGGEIRADAAPGGGARFVFTIPARNG